MTALKSGGYSVESEQCPKCAGFYIKRMAHKSKGEKS
jgi:Zn-finger nucleic acid-binding protein